MHTKGIRVVQIAVGCTLAIGIASLLGLQSSVSAGIITILSLQDTKKETLRSAVDRFAAYALAVLFSIAVFGLLG